MWKTYETSFILPMISNKVGSYGRGSGFNAGNFQQPNYGRGTNPSGNNFQKNLRLVISRHQKYMNSLHKLLKKSSLSQNSHVKAINTKIDNIY